VFIPTDPAATFSPPGKFSVFGYTLCLSCALEPSTPQRVEDKAIAHYAHRKQVAPAK
jgi:hypothetical protein